MSQQSMSHYLVVVLFLCAIAQSDGDPTPTQIKLHNTNGELIAAVSAVRGIEKNRATVLRLRNGGARWPVELAAEDEHGRLRLLGARGARASVRAEGSNTDVTLKSAANEIRLSCTEEGSVVRVSRSDSKAGIEMMLDKTGASRLVFKDKNGDPKISIEVGSDGAPVFRVGNVNVLPK